MADQTKSASDARPRIGVPFRMLKEQNTGDRVAIDRYLKAVRLGGAEPVEVRLDLAPDELRKLAESLDGIALTGSPADVAPALYHAPRHPQTNAADPARDRTDFALIEHCFAEQKPILAICYGIQSLNVYLGGTLVQDIPTEVEKAVEHDVEDDSSPETFHTVRVEPGSRLAEMAHQAAGVRVNSSHHQSVLAPGRGLRVTARAADGVVEALEGTSKDHWVTAVQWHPERLVEDDALSLALFRELTLAARKAAVRA
jgi:putative glutamine amidotransferase